MGRHRNQQVGNPSPRESDNEREGIEPAQAGNEKQTDQITENDSILTGDPDHMTRHLTIIGQVEGHCILPSQNKTTKYEHVIPQLVTVEEEPKVHGLLIILNTMNGDVEAGLATTELMVGMEEPTISLVLGGGHSIGVPLTITAKHSFITQSMPMTIHPVHMSGLVLGVPQTLEYFRRIQGRITRFVTQNPEISPGRFYELPMNTQKLVMGVGTVLIGSDAVKEGLINSVGTLSDVLDYLRNMIDEDHTKEKGMKPRSTRKSPKSAKDTKQWVPTVNTGGSTLRLPPNYI